MVFWPPYPWYIDSPTHGNLTPLSMVFIPRTHGIFTPYSWYFYPPTHGISKPLSMAFCPRYPWYFAPYPWYIDSPTHGILHFDPPIHGIPTSLPMVYQNLSYGIMNPSLLVEMRGVNLPWGGSKYNDEKTTSQSIYHYQNWPWEQYTMGVKIPYDTGTVYQVFIGVPNMTFPCLSITFRKQTWSNIRKHIIQIGLQSLLQWTNNKKDWPQWTTKL
jgi:hypothetical protein